MADVYCSDCKRATEVVFDHSAGDTVCSECGLVLESHSIDETSEWRTFANESGDNDPVRVGGPSNPLLTDGGLSTVISKPNGVTSDFLSSSLGRWQNRGANPDRSLILAFKTIATMSDRLGLVATIKFSASRTGQVRAKPSFVADLRFGDSLLDRANEIYKKVEDQKSSRGRNQDAILAACLYIACRQEDKPRTVKGARKDLDQLSVRRSPISIAAAVIYIITQLSDDKKPLRDVSIATGVAEGTIRNSYKDLYPHISKIIPSWYAKEEDLKNLSSP
ncbi:hypothetical protein C3L33_23100, partial [Rhododendron williamsianum]